MGDLKGCRVAVVATDRKVVVDQNWVSSRKPDDLPAFNREMLRLFRSRRPAAAR